MTAKEMLGKVDHTQLKAFATWEEPSNRSMEEGMSTSLPRRLPLS